MIKSGTCMDTIFREDSSLPVSVKWSYESSEYGDGSLDEEFETTAFLEDGSEIELTQEEKDLLLGELKAAGELYA